MRNKILLAAGLVLALAVQAQSEERVIQVDVVNGRVVVPENSALVQRKHGSIRWEIAKEGYTFAANGIAIRNHNGAFRDCKPIGQGDRYRCIRTRHDAQAVYKYDVNVMQGSTALPVLDPYIRNE